MNILRRKRSQSEKEETEFQSSQLIPLSSMRNIPGYPTVTGTFSLASGAYSEDTFYVPDEIYYGHLSPSSGTFIDSRYWDIASSKTDVTLFSCSYCGTNILVNWNKVTGSMYALTCPNCGAGLK